MYRVIDNPSLLDLIQRTLPSTYMYVVQPSLLGFECIWVLLAMFVSKKDISTNILLANS